MRLAKVALMVRSYRELRVYREAFAAAMWLFRRTRDFPSDEQFGLTSQSRRSSRSVCTNLAEAWRRRRYPAAFVAKLVDAQAEADETRVHIEFALACGYLTKAEAQQMDRRYDSILAQLSRMAAHPHAWMPKTQRKPVSPPSGSARKAESRRRTGGTRELRPGSGEEAAAGPATSGRDEDHSPVRQTEESILRQQPRRRSQ